MSDFRFCKDCKYFHMTSVINLCGVCTNKDYVYHTYADSGECYYFEPIVYEENELIAYLTTLKEQARECGDDTCLKDIKKDSLNFVIDTAINTLKRRL